MFRTPKQWRDFCVTNFQGGYTPGGKAADLYASGQTLAAMLARWGVWKRGDVIADVGCGNGRLAMGLLKAGVIYYGLDVAANSIQFCRKAFSGVGGFIFYHLDVRNAHYAPNGAMDPAYVSYPLQSELVDVVVANSLFSHTETLEVADRNLAEMHRVLKPGGRLFATWRMVPPLAAVDTSADHTNYRREDVLGLLDKHGFIRAAHHAEIPGLPIEINVAKEQTGLLAIKQ